MAKTKRYESDTGSERLQRQQSVHLSDGWSLLNDEHIATAVLWLMAIAGSSATLTGIVQITGWDSLATMFLLLVLLGTGAIVVLRRRENYQRFFLLGAIVVGFVFAVCWQDLFASIKGVMP